MDVFGRTGRLFSDADRYVAVRRAHELLRAEVLDEAENDLDRVQSEAGARDAEAWERLNAVFAPGASESLLAKFRVNVVRATTHGSLEGRSGPVVDDALSVLDQLARYRAALVRAHARGPAWAAATHGPQARRS